MGRVIPIRGLTSWSFSRYNDYKLCPLKAKLKHIDKIQEPPNQAMGRGDTIHKLAEKYIKGGLTRLPAELSALGDEFKKLKALYKKKTLAMTVEDSWAFTRTWEQTVWNDWANCWVRIKLDCAHREDVTKLIITDWKTGRFRPGMNEDYVEQLELYALSGLLMFDDVDTVEPRLGYTDEGRFYPNGDSEPTLIFTRADVPRLKKLWERRTAPMFKDKTFAPRPNDKCVWCHYRAANKSAGGGQCKY